MIQPVLPWNPVLHSLGYTQGNLPAFSCIWRYFVAHQIHFHSSERTIAVELNKSSILVLTCVNNNNNIIPCPATSSTFPRISIMILRSLPLRACPERDSVFYPSHYSNMRLRQLNFPLNLTRNSIRHACHQPNPSFAGKDRSLAPCQLPHGCSNPTVHRWPPVQAQATSREAGLES